MSTDECRFSLERHSCVSGSRPVEFHYHYLTTRTACGLHTERDVASCRVPTGCYSLGSNKIWCFPSVKSIRRCWQVQLLWAEGSCGYCSSCQGKNGFKQLRFFFQYILYLQIHGINCWVLSWCIWDIFGNCKDLSFLLLELIEKKFSLIVGAGVGS